VVHASPLYVRRGDTRKGERESNACRANSGADSIFRHHLFTRGAVPQRARRRIIERINNKTRAQSIFRPGLCASVARRSVIVTGTATSASLFSLPPSEFLGNNVSALFHPASRRSVRNTEN